MEKNLSLFEEPTKEKVFLVIHKSGGKFFNTYGVDSYIISMFFGYKVLDKDKVGFPIEAVDRIKNKLDELKISYQIIYTDKDPEVHDYRNLNNYNKYRKMAIEQVSIMKQIDLIIAKIKKASPEQINEILNVLDKILNKEASNVQNN